MIDEKKLIDKLECRIEESYRNVQPYLKNEDITEDITNELRKMCNMCEAYCGANHDFEECREKPCFKFWLCYKYMAWCMSFGG